MLNVFNPVESVIQIWENLNAAVAAGVSAVGGKLIEFTAISKIRLLNLGEAFYTGIVELELAALEAAGFRVTLTKASPAYLWVPITIPENATQMSFDFQFTQPGDGDYLSVGVEQTQIFVFEGIYFPQPDFQSSSYLDVSAWAGQNVELFVGLSSVGAANSQVVVENFEFHELVESIAPHVFVPDPITLEQETPDGTAAENPSALVFLSGAQGYDILDPEPAIAHDAPAIFTPGATVVTFTATDVSGRSSSATSTVTVVDTTPPDITSPASIFVEQASAAGTPATEPTIAVFLVDRRTSLSAHSKIDPANEAQSAQVKSKRRR